MNSLRLLRQNKAMKVINTNLSWMPEGVSSQQNKVSKSP